MRKLLRPMRIVLRKILKNVLIIIKLRQQLKLNKINFVYAFLPSSLVFVSLAKLTSFSLLKNLRIIMCKRSSIAHKVNIRKKLFILIARIFPQKYLTNSDFLKNELITQYHVDSNKIYVIRNSIDPELRRIVQKPPVRSSNKLINFISIGNIKATKNIDSIVEVMENLQAEGCLFNYIHVGETRNLNPEIYSNNPQIHFVGPCNYSQTLNLLYKSDVFINFSLSEGSANALLEALCMGVPCVLSDIPSNRELAGDQAVYCDSKADLMKVILEQIENFNSTIDMKERNTKGIRFLNYYDIQIKKDLNSFSTTMYN
jgi:glycosyltransferase involved in cell wall biosynthesis